MHARGHLRRSPMLHAVIHCGRQPIIQLFWCCVDKDLGQLLEVLLAPGTDLSRRRRLVAIARSIRRLMAWSNGGFGLETGEFADHLDGLEASPLVLALQVLRGGGLILETRQNGLHLPVG